MITVPPGYPRDILAVLANQLYPESQQPAIRKSLGLPPPVTAVQAARAALSSLP
ncbi:hypothetical protein [Sphaerimonospora thailandensis]|uniref:Uncharacterized protein n=1 Tax=Sphaerimonospora thailandensis TaxID=795644 RepID=A0A8J3VZW5_9ACTN|nr:hypothetical protein [Sphaerimonospora thailandensis]GIH70276.1 hypothetical protein Mth01_25290 [Sphaerimonospora thailandensis]